MIKTFACCGLLAVASSVCGAAETVVPMNAVDAAGVGAAAGSVRVVETPYGLVLYPALTGLPPGLHGFHVHANAACGPGETDGRMQPALAAGGHLDPAATKQHGEPWGTGHLGDLPPLYVAPDGSATNPVLAPRMKQLSEVQGHALMVHTGGDNHADHPLPLGGGGARIVCGVIGR